MNTGDKGKAFYLLIEFQHMSKLIEVLKVMRKGLKNSVRNDIIATQLIIIYYQFEYHVQKY